MLELPNWPNAYPSLDAAGALKTYNSDFRVTELPLETPCGSGEHVWLEVEKDGANSAWVAAQLAHFAGIKEMDVGLAGLKDRHAVTRQWFSLYLPKSEIDFSALLNPEFKILSCQRHSKKLRRGDLLGNKFDIILRQVKGAPERIDERLHLLSEQGVPNYFGSQRFGHDGHNVEAGRAMLAGELRVKQKNKKSIYLSAVRSLIFNQVLALRIERGLWGQTLAGDVLNDQQQPTGPLWGRGRSAATEQALALEQEVIQRFPELADGLEHAGLSQERRSLVAKPEQLSWQWQDDHTLALSFNLAAGLYATSLLAAVMGITEPSRA